MDSSSNSSSLQSHLGSVAGRRGRRGACATPSASPTDRQQQRAGARSPRQERTLAPPPHTPLPPTFPRPFPTLCSSPPIRLHASVHCFGAPRAPPIRPPPPIRQPPSVRTYPPPPPHCTLLVGGGGPVVLGGFTHCPACGQESAAVSRRRGEQRASSAAPQLSISVAPHLAPRTLYWLHCTAQKQQQQKK